MKTNGFTVLQETTLPEYRADGIWARHEASGCEFFHVRNDDAENLFAFAFKTLPSDSTGVAHILEHAVLCGSRRFPVKDPFVMLMRGSLNTFVNAMTYPDKTVYPASSTVPQDLFNIMQVYGDAVFFPLLRKEFFQQEGHRLYYTEDGRLDVSGIVFNEMKGNYATHDSLVAEWAYRSLLPDTPYGYDAGGDPAEITRLTYEDFVGFHRTFYHPSNTRIFAYGNIATDEYLDFLDRHFLSHFGRLSVSSDVPLQPRWAGPREQVVACPADEEGTTSITVNWLLEPVTDPVRIIGYELLDEILLGTSAAPLRKRLIESGLGDDLSAATGLETELHELIFSAGLRGIDGDRKVELEALISDELERLVRDGIDPDIVEGALRKVEFRNREIRGGPNGLRLMGKSLRGWLHGEAPDTTLRFRKPFDELRRAAAPGSRYFEELIRRGLLENAHRSTVTVQPDRNLQERERLRTESWLRELDAAMGDARREEIRRDQAALETLQRSPDPPEAAASIPFLRVSDLPTVVETIPTEEHVVAGGVTVYSHDVFTNGIVYVDLTFDLSGLEPGLLRFVPMFSGALSEVGLPGRSYDQVATEIALKTGGIHSFLDAVVPVHEAHRADRHLYVRMKCLESALPEATALLRELLLSATLDNEPRLVELWRERRSELSGSVLPAGSGYAALRASRAFSDADRYEEEWRGVNQLLFVHEPVERIADSLLEVNNGVIRRGNVTANVTAGETALGRALEEVQRLVAALPEGGWGSRSDPPAGTEWPAREALVVPSDVSYVAAALPASRFGTDGHVHELVVAHLLRTGYLWEAIRMQGGAYGAGASANGMGATFVFSSYRDPRIVETIRAFGLGLDQAAREAPAPADLNLAIIGVTGHDIRPLSPGEKGMVALRRALHGITDEMRQAKRDAVLAASASDIRRAAERLRDSMAQATIVVMGGGDALRGAAAEYPELAENQVVLPV